MKELLILLMIGISLSIDAFSVATCIGIYNLSLKKILQISTSVGLFHFIMPLLGFILSNQIFKYILINTNLVLGIILSLIALQMLIEYLKPSKKDISLNKIGIFLFAFGVSLDSFSIGLGIKAITNNLLLSSTIFTICSFSFTFLGLSIGKYITKIFKKYSYLVGTILLLTLGVIFIHKSF